MKNFYRSILVAFFSLTLFSAFSQGWPANYEGVMLQGFYWDSYSDTKWTNLESQADELSQYFDLIWVPNSGRSASNPGMGYDPVYWFTNHNSSFGTEAEIRQMIKTYKAKGVGIIEDVVINHRSGATNWTDFPAETWNGTTWKIGTDGICSTDEVKDEPGQAKPTGNPDTGDDFGSSRDLDHTNANVQNNVKNYCKFLLEDMGYTGFRLDMVKGYAGQYTKLYNEYSKPQFSVGEYWDSSYDNVAAWIEATGKTSAAFDFPLKYQLQKAFSGGGMTELSWSAFGNPQPAGMIHYGYPQYSVTFVDNHDTYRENDRFPDDNHILAANAFILSSPGTPCVFLKHYIDPAYKSAIQAMIKARKAAGVSNTSQVTVEKLQADCYMAVVQGSKGKLAVKIGSAMVSPNGFSDSEIATSGNDYCIWVKTSGGNNSSNGNTTGGFTVYFDNSTAGWIVPWLHYWGASESSWPGVPMTKYKDNVWSYTVPAGTTGILFHPDDNPNWKTQDMDALADHLYSVTQDGSCVGYDNGIYSDAKKDSDQDDNTGDDKVDDDKTGGDNTGDDKVDDDKTGGDNTGDDKVGDDNTGDDNTGGDNTGGDNTGGDNTGGDNTGGDNTGGDNTGGDNTEGNDAGIDGIFEDIPKAQYYNLQGIRVENPGKGLYIKITGNRREKIVIR